MGGIGMVYLVGVVGVAWGDALFLGRVGGWHRHYADEDTYVFRQATLANVLHL